MDSIAVEVSMKDLTKDNAHGWCYDKGNNRSYKIELEKTMDTEEMLIALCHEMVHVRQYSEGNSSNEYEAEALESELAERYKSS